MHATQSNILVFVIHKPTVIYFKFNFLSFTCDIDLFHRNVYARFVCYGAECDMFATQCNVLLWTLNFMLE